MDITLTNRNKYGYINDEKPTFREAVNHKVRITPQNGQLVNQLAQQQVNEQISRSLSDNAESTLLEGASPQLRAPQAKLGNQAQVLLLLCKIKGVTHELKSSKLANAVAMMNIRSDAAIRSAREASEAIDALTVEYDKAFKEVKAANTKYDSALEAMSKAKSQLARAQAKLDDVLRQYGVNSAKDPAVRDNPEVQIYVKELENAQRALAKEESLLKATENEFLALSEKAQNLLNRLNAATKLMNEKYSDVEFRDGVLSADQQSEHALDRLSLMILLISDFINKCSESSVQKLKDSNQVNRMQMEVRQEEMKRKSDEYEEKVRKAEEIQKAASCVSKIIGAVTIAIGVVTSVFGGAGLALMAVGLALLVVDKITEAITGETLTGMIMEKTLLPLIEFLTKAIAWVFDKVGLNALLGETTAAIVHSVIATIQALAIVLLVAILAKSAIGPMMSKLSQAFSSAIAQTIKSTVQRVIQKVIPNAMRNAVKSVATKAANMAKNISNIITKQVKTALEKVNDIGKRIVNVALKNVSSKSADMIRNMTSIITNKLAQLNIALTLSSTVTTCSMNIATGAILKSASDVLAEARMAGSDIDILRNYLNSIASAFKKESEMQRGLTQNLTDILSSSVNSRRYVAHNIQA